MKKIFISLFLLISLITSTCYAFSNNYTWTVVENTLETSSTDAQQILDDNFLNLEAGSAILIEQNSGQILYGYNVHEKLHLIHKTLVVVMLLVWVGHKFG